MNIETVHQDSVVVARVLDQRLDLTTSREFKNQMLDLISGGADGIVLDLSAVDFLDSSGLTSIVSTLKALGPKGGMAIGAVSEPVEKVFRLTRIHKVIPIFESIQEAAASLAQDR